MPSIAQLYKCRWQVELFFKWIKQNLRIKHFFGTSDNAVKTQVWIAICVYVLAAIVRKELRLELSLSQILQVLSVNPFEQVPLAELIAKTESQDNLSDYRNQLILWNTVNGGTNASLWTNSTYVGSWTNATSTNISCPVAGLTPNKLYYFTFRATNTLDTMWAANVQSVTTLAPIPPTPVLAGSAVLFAGGSPAFTFATVSGYKYRLAYKNALMDIPWLPVIAPTNFPLPDGWSATSTGSPMSLTDPNTAGQPQRFYRLETVHPQQAPRRPGYWPLTTDY